MSAAVPIPILFRDARFVVLDKPPGLPVHPGPRGGPSVEDCFPTLSRRKSGPWLAHRLDADTSGCLAVALRRAALIEAQAAFTAGTVEKIYWAIVEGSVEQPEGTIDLPLAKHTTKAGWRMRPDPAGQPAITAWRVLGRSAGRTWLELSPRTGRTHQVRVHCAALGMPLVGDPIYGASTGASNEALHLLARSLTIPLTPSVEAVAPPPAHMRRALSACGWVSP